MQKIKDFCKRHRLLWLTLLVALAAAAVAAWAGFDLGQRVDNQPVYEIVNDDYTRNLVKSCFIMGIYILFRFLYARFKQSQKEVTLKPVNNT